MNENTCARKDLIHNSENLQTDFHSARFNMQLQDSMCPRDSVWHLKSTIKTLHESTQPLTLRKSEGSLEAETLSY